MPSSLFRSSFLVRGARLALLGLAMTAACDQVGADDGDPAGDAPALQEAALATKLTLATAQTVGSGGGALADKYRIGLSCPSGLIAQQDSVTSTERQCCTDAGCTYYDHLVATEGAGWCREYVCDCGLGTAGGLYAADDDNAFVACLGAHH